MPCDGGLADARNRNVKAVWNSQVEKLEDGKVLVPQLLRDAALRAS